VTSTMDHALAWGSARATALAGGLHLFGVFILLAGAFMPMMDFFTNAVLHIRSGHQGGTFNMEVTAIGRESLMVAVTDEGGPTGPCLLTPAQADAHFRGLQVVQGLTRLRGGRRHGRRTVWALFAPLGRGVPCPDGPC
jgi:hypothetical protein